MSNPRKELERAFKLIKRDKIDEALSILRPVVDSDPNNVHAWWLLAYAATEPHEVREALLQVLSLDPNYANAPKAHDMLIKLNQEYPPDSSELMRFPELRAYMSDVPEALDDMFLESPFDDFEEPGSQETFAPFSEDVFGEVEFPESGEAPFPIGDSFTKLGESPFGDEGFPEPEEAPGRRKKPKTTQIAGFDFEPEQIDDEALAAKEERAVARRGRGRRLIRMALGFVGAVAVALLILFLGLRSDKSDTSTDSGQLRAIEGEDTQVMVIQAAAFRALQASEIGSSSRAVVARSDLGDTLFIEICGHPTPGLPQLVEEGMTIAAQQAVPFEDQLKAVGVSVDVCGTERHDTLYRAIAPLEDAARFARGEMDWETFQALWKKT